MSFEGYYQIKCENNHYYTENVYTFSFSSSRCSYCNGKIIATKMVDETNGESEGYDPKFSENCDVLVSVWKSQLEFLTEEKEKFEKIAKCKYMHKIKINGEGYCSKCGWNQNL
jgi:hypothetical protein